MTDDFKDEYQTVSSRIDKIFRNEVLRKFAEWSAREKGINFKPIIKEYEEAEDAKQLKSEI